MRDLNERFHALDQSSFRRQFRREGRELDYLLGKGLETILGHAAGFIEKRLAAANPANDGRQTPMRNHPVFIAQHATATCCRGCLQKWHDIPKGHELREDEKRYVLGVIERWLSQQAQMATDDNSGPCSSADVTRDA
jgi:predicted Fe-S protein YdhL (DUF1289 family)